MCLECSPAVWQGNPGHVLESRCKPALVAWNGPELPQSTTPSIHRRHTSRSSSSFSFPGIIDHLPALPHYPCLRSALDRLRYPTWIFRFACCYPTPPPRYCLFWATHVLSLGNLQFPTITLQFTPFLRRGLKIATSSSLFLSLALHLVSAPTVSIDIKASA